MRPLSVAQLLPALESGGVERSTLEISDALVRAGHRALVVSAGGRLQPQLESLGAEHIKLDIGRKSPLVLREIGRLRALFRDEEIDVVHARSRLPAWIAVLALLGLPAARRPRLVTTVHGINSVSRYSAVMTLGERVICVSDTVRRHVLEHYPRTDPRKLRVIARGIDPASFPPAPWPDRDARAWAAEQHPSLGGEGPLLLLPGRGTRLLGGAIRTELTREELEKVLVDGFFPAVPATARPVARARAGLTQVGLPYASDAAITADDNYRGRGVYDRLRRELRGAQGAPPIQDFNAQILADRKRGYVFHRSTVDPGLVSLAYPIRDHDSRVVAAVTVIVPEKLSDTIGGERALRPMVYEAADAISRKIGYRG